MRIQHIHKQPQLVEAAATAADRMLGKGVESWWFGGREQDSEMRRKEGETAKSVIEHGMQKRVSKSVALHRAGIARVAWRRLVLFGSSPLHPAPGSWLPATTSSAMWSGKSWRQRAGCRPASIWLLGCGHCKRHATAVGGQRSVRRQWPRTETSAAAGWPEASAFIG